VAGDWPIVMSYDFFGRLKQKTTPDAQATYFYIISRDDFTKSKPTTMAILRRKWKRPYVGVGDGIHHTPLLNML